MLAVTTSARANFLPMGIDTVREGEVSIDAETRIIVQDNYRMRALD